jgi:deazaflavin-dependent oxidoreductase (nitroreductase family)
MVRKAQPVLMTRAMRFGTAMVKRLLRVGVPMGPLMLLAVRGRTSGNVYATPVALVVQGQERWLVAAFGEVSWVRNLRAAKAAELIRGRQVESIGVVELGSDAAGPILQRFLRAYHLVPFIPPSFQATPQSPREAFEQEAKSHPVFQIVPKKVSKD